MLDIHFIRENADGIMVGAVVCLGEQASEITGMGSGELLACRLFLKWRKTIGT